MSRRTTSSSSAAASSASRPRCSSSSAARTCGSRCSTRRTGGAGTRPGTTVACSTRACTTRPVRSRPGCAAPARRRWRRIPCGTTCPSSTSASWSSRCTRGAAADADALERGLANGVPGLEEVGARTHPGDRAARHRDRRAVVAGDRDHRLRAVARGTPATSRRSAARSGSASGHGDRAAGPERVVATTAGDIVTRT